MSLRPAGVTRSRVAAEIGGIDLAADEASGFEALRVQVWSLIAVDRARGAFQFEGAGFDVPLIER